MTTMKKIALFEYAGCDYDYSIHHFKPELSKKAITYLGKIKQAKGFDLEGMSIETLREDTDLIKVIEVLGVEKASGYDTSIILEEYDAQNYEYDIRWCFDHEELELIPVVRKAKLEELTPSEIADYLTSLGIVVR